MSGRVFAVVLGIIAVAGIAVSALADNWPAVIWAWVVLLNAVSAYFREGAIEGWRRSSETWRHASEVERAMRVSRGGLR